MKELADMDVVEVVANGSAFLDERYPDWYDHMLIVDHDMSDCTACVLGQLFTPSNYHADMDDPNYAHLLRSGYSLALRALGSLGIVDDWMEIHGFSYNGNSHKSITWPTLNAAWALAIESRRAANPI